MHELTDPAAVQDAAAGDPLLSWAAQGLGTRPGVRAWVRRSAGGSVRAVACAHRDLSRRDRLAVRGEPAAAADLVDGALAEVGPTYRVLGTATLVEQLVARRPGLEPTPVFWWMQTDRPPPPPGPATTWDVADVEVAAVLRAANPGSYAWPGGSGVRRWAGCRDQASGRLLAVGADAWSAERVAAAAGVGFVAGIATLPQARGRGLGGAVTALLLRDLVARHGLAALMVDDAAGPARRLYRALGLVERPLRAAALSPGAARGR